MCDIHFAKHAHAAASRTAAQLKVFRTYRSASCVRSRVRVSPARLASSPCVKQRRATRKKKKRGRWRGEKILRTPPHSREARRACGTHRCRAAAASCSRVGKSRVRNVSGRGGGGRLFLVFLVFLHLRHLLLSPSGDRSPRNLRSRRCA